MKYLDFYKNILNIDNNPNDIFKYLISSLKPGNTIWSYFVNWEKVFENTKNIEVALNTMNYLIGKEDFDEAFKFLITKHPEVAIIIPSLVVRDGGNTKNFQILVDYSNKKLIYKKYDFSNKKPTSKDIEMYLVFAKKTGLKDLLISGQIKNLVDYMIGVEAGLDSNARKNRGGHVMEKIILTFISDLCNRKGYKYLKEANANKIKSELGYDVPVDKSSRRYDFVVDKGNELIIIEVNFYGGGGSKLKATAGEYKNLYNVLKNRHKFVWITDGYGWLKTEKPLKETFEHNDYIFNLKMLEEGILDYI